MAKQEKNRPRKRENHIPFSFKSMPKIQPTTTNGVDSRSSVCSLFSHRDRWANKLGKELANGHLWSFVTGTALLIFGKLDSGSWVTLVLGLTGLRGAAEIGRAYMPGAVKNTDDYGHGE